MRIHIKDMREMEKQYIDIELIDWAERFPNATAYEIAIIQSTVCHKCGGQKKIGIIHCL